jgi:hypothetical protein
MNLTTNHLRSPDQLHGPVLPKAHQLVSGMITVESLRIEKPPSNWERPSGFGRMVSLGQAVHL